MDNSEIIIFIVVFVVAIINAFGKATRSKKASRKPQTAVRPEIRKPAPEMETAGREPEQWIPTLSDLLGGLTQQVAAKPADRQEPVVEKKTMVTSSPAVQELPEEGVSVFGTSQEDEIDDSSVYQDRESDSPDEETDAIDWRQAVITTEILNRKY